MKRSPQEDLLKEILADEALDAVRENALAGGLAALRARRRNRAVRTAVFLGAPLVILSALVLRPTTNINPAASVASAPTVAHASIKIYPATTPENSPPIAAISDEELLALFKDQSVGLLGTPGQQQLLVFNSTKVAMQ